VFYEKGAIKFVVFHTTSRRSCLYKGVSKSFQSGCL